MSLLPAPSDRPEPVTLAGKIAATTGYLGSALAMFGVLTATEAEALNSTTAALLVLVSAVPAAVAPVVAAVRARREVTPLSAPRDDDGRRLVPAGTDGTLYDQQHPAG